MGFAAGTARKGGIDQAAGGDGGDGGMAKRVAKGWEAAVVGFGGRVD